MCPMEILQTLKRTNKTSLLPKVNYAMLKFTNHYWTILNMVVLHLWTHGLKAYFPAIKIIGKDGHLLVAISVVYSDALWTESELP